MTRSRSITPNSAARIRSRLRRRSSAVAHHADIRDPQHPGCARQNRKPFFRSRQVPAGVVEDLGVPVPEPGPLPEGFDPLPPYFVSWGAIEPRKITRCCWMSTTTVCLNRARRLLILGARGWSNEAVFTRLDKAKSGACILEMPARQMPPWQRCCVVRALCCFPALQRALDCRQSRLRPWECLLFLPDLPVIHELLGDKAVYLNPTDSYSWLETIKESNAAI